MDPNQERLYSPGQAPLPYREPMASLGQWGAPPPPTPPLDSPAAYASPGPPPGVKSSRKFPTWAVLAVAVGGMFAICAGCVGVALLPEKDGGPVAATIPAQTDSPDATKSPASGGLETAVIPAATGLGDRVRAGDFEYVVHKVKCGISRVGDKSLNQRPQGSFCRVDITARNVTRKPHLFHADSVVKARDDSGREFSPDGMANIYGNEDTAGFLSEINPGNRVRAFVFFDVSKETKLVQIVLDAGLFTLADDAVVELG